MFLEQADPIDFMSISLVNNRIEVRMELGEGEDAPIVITGLNMGNLRQADFIDGKWHTIEIFKTREVDIKIIFFFSFFKIFKIF